MTKEELERQTEALARQLQDAIDHWDDPDRVAQREAYEREKDERQRDVFERSYLRTGQRKPSDTLEQAIGKMARFFSDELEQGAENTQPLPVLDTGEDVSLVVTTVDGKQHVLELLVERKATIAKEVLVRGTLGQVLALLRAPQAAEYLVLFTQKLRGRLGAQDHAIANAARELAEEVERAPAAGPFEHVYRSIGVVAPAGELAFRFAPNPLEPDRRFLELRVSSPSGLTTSGRWIHQGSNAEIAAFLRDAHTPTLVEETMTALLEGQKQDGYA